MRIFVSVLCGSSCEAAEGFMISIPFPLVLCVEQKTERPSENHGKSFRLAKCNKVAASTEILLIYVFMAINLVQFFDLWLYIVTPGGSAGF